MLHFRTEAEKDFSFSFQFSLVLGFSPVENVFTTRDCCSCNAVQQGMEIPHLYQSLGHMSAPEGTEGLGFGFPCVHYILLLGCCPVGIPVRGRGCRTGLFWLAVELGCTQTHEPEAEALPGCPCAVADAEVFCGNGMLSRAVVQPRELQGILPPWNVLTKIREPANCFSWCVCCCNCHSCHNSCA